MVHTFEFAEGDIITKMDSVINGKKNFGEKFSACESENVETMNNKANRPKANPGQCRKLFSFMNGRMDFTKGKMKNTEETTNFLMEWNQFTSQLNDMGPPCYSSSKWRRVWTRLKSKKKTGLSSTSVLRSRDDNKILKDRRCEFPSISNHPTSNVKHGNVINTKDDVESEHNQTIELPPLETTSKTLDVFMKNQELVNQELNRKMDVIIQQQAVANAANEKLIHLSEILASIFVEDINV